MNNVGELITMIRILKSYKERATKGETTRDLYVLDAKDDSIGYQDRPMRTTFPAPFFHCRLLCFTIEDNRVKVVYRMVFSRVSHGALPELSMSSKDNRRQCLRLRTIRRLICQRRRSCALLEAVI